MKGRLGIALKMFAGLVLLMIAAIVFVLSGFYDIHVRYRLSVEVQDGDQTKTGSSVIDVSYAIQPDYIWVGPNSRPGTIAGYAPTVDLGEKGLLFLTFVNADRTPDQIRARGKALFCLMDDLWCLPFAAYDKPGTGVVARPFGRLKVELAELLHHSGPRDVPFILLPQLARFRDINDPRTFVPVSPDNLAASFSPGVQLKRAILQLTGDPVTPQPQVWPQWLKQDGQMYDGTLK
jgi:hypothetical protein